MEFVRTNSKGKLVFPKKLPRGRTNLADRLCIASSITLVISFLAALCIIFLVCVEFVKRVLHTVEEYKDHLESRYAGDCWTLLKKVWYCRTTSIIVFFLAIIVLAFRPYGDHTLDITHLALVAAAIAFIHKHLSFGNSPLATSLKIRELNGLDYGSGMAHSFFHGYLKINLNAEDGLVDLMSKYEGKEKIKFHEYKLLILLPLSFHCPHSLSKLSQSVEIASSLESIFKNRAGVRERVYKNSVYKIMYQINGESLILYVSAEYATPLKTFEEVISSNRHSSAYYKEHSADIIYNFYYTLNRLIEEDSEITNVCEVIYYDDKDENGKFIDVGEMLKKKLVLDEKNKKMK